MTKKSERQPIKAENVAGGAGYILKEELIKGEQLGAYCKMFNEVTLKPGCEIGYHEHHGETETYYLTKGAGIYNDNGKEYPVSFTKEGRFSDGEADSPKDLFMVGEKKEGWINIYEAFMVRCIGAVYNSKETAMRMKVNEKDITYITTVRVEWEE